ncbi:MAG TPA: HPF/RaiA family ribosome-associated protein [Gammaproteobacteria bacterium]|jgi:ribosomal subunit interface protein
MTIPLDIVFLNMDHSDAVQSAIEERIGKLEQFSQQIMRCRVTVEAPHKHHAKGNIYHVAIDMHLPGAEIVVNRAKSKNHAHEDVYVAIRDAVNAAGRQLQDHIRQSRGEIKVHEAPPHGTVSELHPAEDYGRIATPDGRLIYFHRNSLLDGNFDDLTIGTEVRFDEEQGDEGPQATTVRLIGKHHIVS